MPVLDLAKKQLNWNISYTKVSVMFFLRILRQITDIIFPRMRSLGLKHVSQLHSRDWVLDLIF